MITGSMIKKLACGSTIVLIFSGACIYAAMLKGNRFNLASAICNSNDTYDLSVGVALAEERLMAGGDDLPDFGWSRVTLPKPPFISCNEDLLEHLTEFLQHEF